MIEPTGSLNREGVRIASNQLTRLFEMLGKTKMIEEMPDYVAGQQMFGALDASLLPTPKKSKAPDEATPGEAA